MGTRKVLLVDIDDLGKAFLEQAEHLGFAPNIARMRSLGMDFTRFWAAPLCSPFRGRLLTGLDAYRYGNWVGRNYNPEDVVSAPRGTWIASNIPGATKRGKWHVSGMLGWAEAITGQGRYERFSGTYSNLTVGTSNGYYDWTRVFAAAGQVLSIEQSNTFATNDTYAAALTDVGAGCELIHASFNAVHAPFEQPPPHEPPNYVYQGGGQDDRKRELLLHLDWRLGQLVDAAIAADYVVFIACDNGTGGHGKGEMSERGICTPFFVLGRGVQTLVTDRMVSATDLFATVRRLTGAPEVATPDSVDFLDAVLPSEPQVAPPRRMLTCDDYPDLGLPPNPNAWRRAIRDGRWKLIDWPDAPAGTPVQSFYDLLGDPNEQQNLLDGPLHGQDREAYDRLLDALPTL